MATIGTNFPITIPALSDTANIVTALTNLHYGSAQPTDSAATLFDSTNGVAGHLQRLSTLKADLLNPRFSSSGIKIASGPTFSTTIAPTGPTLSANITVVLPTISTTLVGNNTVDTLSNKTLTGPTFTGAVTSSPINGTTIPASSILVTTSYTGPIAASTTGSAASATTSTNISGGVAGNVPFQSNTGTTSFVPNGVSGYVLTSNGATAPSWVSPSTLAGVDTAVKANNLSGGDATTGFGSIPYQTSVDGTTLLGPNLTSTKKFLSQTGATNKGEAPSWSVVSKSDVGLSAVENVALSSWTGSSNITQVGTLASLTVSGTLDATANAAKNVVYYGGATGTMSYVAPTNKIYTGSTPPSTGLVVGDIWMW